MSETVLTTGIRLSTGTTINIPVFRYNEEREVNTEMGGVVMIRKWDPILQQFLSQGPLTDAELWELGSMFSTSVITSYANNSSIVVPPPAGWTDCYRVYLIYYMENGDGTYTLNTNIYGRTNYLYEGETIFHGVASYSGDVDDVYREWFVNGYTTNVDANKFQDFYSAATYFANHQSSHDANWIKFANLTSDSIQADYMDNLSLLLNGGHIDSDPDYIHKKLEAYTELVPGNGIMLVDTDPDDPYTYEASTMGGGDGRWGSFDPNSIDPAQIPSLPTISAANAGFISVFNPTINQLKSLSAFLWSNAFDLDSFKKLFQDPMQAIIGLSVVPVQPSLAGSSNVMFGSVDTGVSMQRISSEYVEKNMGSVNIDLLYGSFMDYEDKIMIYLPYIGFRELSAIDVVGHSVSVTYHINVLDGGTTAYVVVSGKGVMYQFSGSCIANIPLSAINYSGALQNAITAVAGTSLGSGLLSLKGIAGVATSMHGTVQRSGNVSGSSGLMGIQRPFIIIERSNISVPALANNFRGNTSNITLNLGSLSGFTKVDKIHLDDVICTEDERTELMTLLREGVIL